MPDTQEEIDALMAEANALADEAVRQIVDEPAAAVAVADPPPVAAPAQAVPPSGRDGKPRRVEDVRRILSLEVPVIVQLAERTLPLSEIINLTSGAIIEFEKPSDCLLDLMINNKCIGKGQAVKVGENFGLRVKTIGSVRDRIQALRNE